MRKVCVLPLAALFLISCNFELYQTVKVPSKWVGGPVILSAGPKGSFDDVAVKDPTIVYYQGKWHLFYTVSGKEPGGIGYVSARTLDLLKTAPRHKLEQFSGQTSDSKGGAPQAFYFEPHKLWYLIYQTKDFNRQPVYSTTPTIDKPESWSKTRNLIVRDEPDVKWIDFWIICDDANAYFFYSRGRKDVYVRRTKIEDFPNGFGPARLAFSPMPEPLTEAVHIYKVRGKKEYRMFYETKPEGRTMRRYGLATASNLLGPWTRVADDYAIGDKLVFGNPADRWTDEVSHGEMIRTGYNQKLEYDPADGRFLIQGLRSKAHVGEYRRLGWRLGIIKPSFNKPGAAAYVSDVHFRPCKRAVGDVMPFYWKGEYHVFYLLNATGNHDINWEHVVSTDLVHWKELEPALRWGPNDPTGPDGGTMFTGCVIEKDGLFHAFYTGWNPKNPKGREFVMHATSTDLNKWTKHRQDIIAPDGIHYANHRERDFRDPHVFWNERQKQYWMLLFANDAETKENVVGVLTSKDLKKWQQVEPLEGVRGQECPDLFTIGDTHYLLGASYAFSKNLHGPYRKPPISNIIDRPVIYAGKRMFDGRRHIWVGGWLKGPMSLPRELRAGPQGQLYCRPVEEVVAAFNKTAFESDAQSELAAGSRVSFDVPDNYMLDCRVKLDADSKLAIGMRRQQGTNEGYELVLDAALGRLQLTGASFDYKRPCPVDTSKPVKVQAFVMGTTIECFVNDQYAQTCLASKYDKGKLSFNVEGGGAKLLQVTVKTARLKL